jgi:hypothetical protein
MATVMDKKKVLSIERRVKVIRQIENGKKESGLVSGIWSRKFHVTNYL